MAKHGVEVATFNRPAESCCCATLDIVLDRLMQDRRHHAASLAGRESCAPTYALRRYQCGNDQRRRKRSQRVIERLSGLLDSKTFRSMFTKDPARHRDSASVTFHGKRHFF